LESRYRAQLDSKDDEFDNVKFSYAWGLIRSQHSNDIRRGISLLEELRFSDASRDRECRYYISVGYFKLGKYGDAKGYLAPLINSEPKNEQFVLLQSEIDHYINRGTSKLMHSND
jgi:fission 1 protein